MSALPEKVVYPRPENRPRLAGDCGKKPPMKSMTPPRVSSTVPSIASMPSRKPWMSALPESTSQSPIPEKNPMICSGSACRKLTARPMLTST
ncbi:hypothetical protein ACFPRL_30475 [Pseudoclavibacter helvolus]